SRPLEREAPCLGALPVRRRRERASRRRPVLGRPPARGARRTARPAGGPAARAPPPAPPGDLRTISSDPPDCVAVRALLNAALVPRVRAIAPRIDAIVDELVTGLAGEPGVAL